jgi:hypothetical protein
LPDPFAFSTAKIVEGNLATPSPNADNAGPIPSPLACNKGAANVDA